MMNKTQTASIIFRVVKDNDGNPVQKARVSFVVDFVPLPDIATLTDTNGTFKISTPVSGEYVIADVSDKFIGKETKITVEPNQDTHVQIGLVRSNED